MNVVVVGSGIAGLTAALHAHDAGHEVTVVTKGDLGDGSTRYAQGGVAGVYGPDDSAQQHARDTMIAGAGLSDAAAVDVIVTDGAARIAELIARGVAFDRDADGMLLLGREAAHSHARIVHAGGDATGLAISHALVAAVRRTPITVVEHAFVTDLIVTDAVVRGIRLLVADPAQEAAIESTLSADAVVLATGGAGHLYAHTTNPSGATGDGIAAALRAGAAVDDLEFVQFHPTILACGSAFLISEAVRGEGATLIDDHGRRFVFDSHSDGELAPRDVVSRALARQATAQGSPVRLDATMLGAETLAARFPTIDRVTRERGFDWSRAPIPVTPAAHYLMGGIVTDLHGRSTIPGLFAVGEAARTGVHGANRLASNSLLEGAVFGARAAAALDAPFRAALPLPLSISPRESIERLSGSSECFDSSEGTDFSRAALQQLMWDEVGLLRTGEGLSRARDTVHFWRATASTPRTISDHEDANLLLIAEATVVAALSRTASVGAHYRHADAHARTTAPILETV